MANVRVLAARESAAKERNSRGAALHTPVQGRVL